MKKNKWIKWIRKNLGAMAMLICYVLMGFGCGIMIAQAADLSGGGLMQMLFLLLCGVYGSFLLHIILHEAGHMVFGLLTGYRFVSFRIGSFVWQRTEEGKIRAGVSPLPGAAGQCLMSPPEMVNGTMPFVLYNLGGALMNLIIALICLLGRARVSNPAAQAIFSMCALVGAVTAVTNGVPMRVGAMDNDGYNIRAMMKSKEAVKSLWLQLKISELGAQGVRMKDMPEEWFFMPAREEMKNSLCAAVGVFYCARLMDEMKFTEALAAMRGMLRPGGGMAGMHRASMKMDMACCELLAGRGRQAAEGALDQQTKKIMKAMKTHLSAIRTEYILALLGKKDEKKAEELLGQFEKAAEKWPSGADVESERELIERAKTKAEEEKSRETKESKAE